MRFKTTYLPKRAQSSQNAASNPSTVLPLRRRKDLDPHILNRESLHLVQQSIAESLSQGAPTRQDNIAKQRFPQVQIRPVDSVDNNLVDTGVLKADDFRIKQNLRGAEPLSANLCMSVKKPVLNRSEQVHRDRVHIP